MHPTRCATPAPLTSAHVEQFRSYGYCAVPGFFAADAVQALQAAVRGLQASGKLRNVATGGDGVTPDDAAPNLQICPVGADDLLIRALPFAPQVPAALTLLLGPCVAQILDQIFLKPARHGAGTSWHTDNHYFRMGEVTRGTGMWIAVHDATRANGTMRVIPGSHQRAWRHRRDLGSNHHFTCADLVDEAEAVPIELAAGGVLFFNFGIAHATGPNATDRDRAGLACHFVGCDQPMELPAFEANYPRGCTWVAGPACSGGRAEWRQDLAQAWRDEVTLRRGMPA